MSELRGSRTAARLDGQPAQAAGPIPVVFLLLPHSLLLDWAGPAEAFRLANQHAVRTGAAAVFTLRFIGPQPDAISSVGATIAQIAPLPAQIAPGSWLVVVGSPDDHATLADPDYRRAAEWLRHAGPQLHAGGRLITICTGALLAAKAGLLAGRRATTHHLSLEKLRAMETRCEVIANRVFVVDDRPDYSVYSSAGITAGIDLALHLIAETAGASSAAAVGQTMVVALRRGPGDPELSPFLDYRNHIHPALHRVQDAVSQRPQESWTADAMAALACTSPRHLARLFQLHTGIAPLQYVRRIRLAVAESALRSGHSVTMAAAAAGFSSDTQLRRAWQQTGRVDTPSAVQRNGN